MLYGPGAYEPSAAMYEVSKLTHMPDWSSTSTPGANLAFAYYSSCLFG